MTFVEIDKCPVCGGDDFDSIDVGSPSGWTWLNPKIKGCSSCGCVVLRKIAKTYPEIENEIDDTKTRVIII